MPTICEIKDKNNLPLVKIFTSTATNRKNAFRVHHHIEFELSIIMQGNGCYRATHEYEIQPQDIFCYKSNESHCITDIEPPFMEIMNIHISPQFFKHLNYIAISDTSFGTDFLQCEFPENKVNDFINEGDLEIITKTFYLIKQECEQQKSSYEIVVMNALNQILVILKRYALSDQIVRQYANHKAEQIFKIAAYIDENFCDELKLSSLAEMANLDRFYFCRIYKKIIGLSPFEYITIKRVEKALFLLRNTQKNILDIALECGFNNTANFNKLFKKYTGATPKQLK